jgi:BirA family biotin operon repressor/biotin-[acetyl-CoA-carboxylase] ligase
MRFGRPRRHLRVAASTNDLARDLAAGGAPSGTVVTADEQTAGRGRSGRRWSAPAGSALLASAVLAPLDEHHALLPLAVPIAVCEAIESLAPVACRVKWPNDVWICELEAEERRPDSGPKAKPGMPGRKVAGVLIEARPPEWAVIGVGINLAIPDQAFPADLRWPATSVGHGVERDAMLGALCGRLDAWAAAPPERAVESFGSRDALRSRRIGWEGAGGRTGSGEGTAMGVDPRGNLLVETSEGTIALGSGEVQLEVPR